MQVFRVSDLLLVRQLVSREDEANVAVWHPQPGQGICYGTKAGHVRNIVACSSASVPSAAVQSSVVAGAGLAGDATSVLQSGLR